MADVAAIVDAALRAAGIPIDGVSVGTVSDRATWLVVYAPAATAPQRVTGDALVLTTPIDAAAASVQDEKSAQLQIDGIPIVLKAVILALIDQLNVIRAGLPTPLGAITPAQALAAIRAKAGTL